MAHKPVSVMDVIADKTNGESCKTTKYGFDGFELPRLDYDDNQQVFVWKEHGETNVNTNPTDLTQKARELLSAPPLFRYFLDGSRHVYKVDDISYNDRVYPVIAGQVGVGCCVRDKNHNMRSLSHNGKLLVERHLVVALPQAAKKFDSAKDLSLNYVRDEVNKVLAAKHLSLDKILSYSTSTEEKLENKGIAAIQDYMIALEKQMVAELTRLNLLGHNMYLLKDGSLEYPIDDLHKPEDKARFLDNYRYVVGASKSFNPANCLAKGRHNVSNKIANLPLYHRTPVQMFEASRAGRTYFAVWFVRIRERKHTIGPFDGILKLEKMLATQDQAREPLDSDMVDTITANVINERNPVCYGVDKRWANHLYPVFATERLIKSKYMGQQAFLNLF